MIDDDEVPREPTRFQRALPKIALLAVVAFGGSAVAGTVLALTHRPSPGLRAATVDDVVRQGVVVVAAARAFLVSDGAGILALYHRDPHRGEFVGYCPSSGWFEEPLTGDKFDRLGAYRLGPAPRGLDRFPVRIDDGWVYVDTGILLRGPDRGAARGPDPTGPFCTARGVQQPLVGLPS